VAVEADADGMYSKRAQRPTLLQPLSQEQAVRIVDGVGGVGTQGTMGGDGNLMLGGLFGWLWDEVGGEEGIGELIDEEFAIYLWHKTRRNVIPNNGWLRTIYYSLI